MDLSSLLLYVFALLQALAIPLQSLSSSFTLERNAGPLPKCGKLTPRREWRTLTNGEKSRWVGAVKCLASIKHQRLSLTADQTMLQGQRSLYDDFSYAHASVAHSVHGNAYFLPWPYVITYMRVDRWFTTLFDTSLRRTCGYVGPTPYWDWSRDHADLFVAPVFEDSPEHGLGGTGDCDSFPEADCTVTTGAFARDFELAWPIPHPLRRNLTILTGWYAHELPQNSTLGPDFVRNTTEQTTGDFFRFQHAMELLHNHVHNFVGGDMGGDCPRAIPDKDCDGVADTFTPNDPLFWLHHAQLDRLWSEWQRNHPSNFNAFSGMPLGPHNGTDPRYDPYAHPHHPMPFDVQSVPVTPSSIFDTESWPLCYRYLD